ncbi:MAG: prepilin-type N-terminal cleavage/methylation domain-containing protein [bacterium]|jgi:type II secretion system protein G|nr:prepilin-type N-terminal cleavage/methylation domain-containing protein [bacterium]
MERRQAFTLIELLIVVAIIGILAAIAVPNFLNAQLKAKIASSVSDMRAVETALEMYRLDNNRYPYWRDASGVNINPVNRRLIALTSPMAYMSSVPQDPFVFGPPGSRIDETQHEAYVTYDYIEAKSQQIHNNLPLGAAFRCAEWRLNGYGPDGLNDTGYFTYNASNGLRSRGDLTRTGPRTGLSCDDSWVDL